MYKDEPNLFLAIKTYSFDVVVSHLLYTQSFSVQYFLSIDVTTSQ